jgi:hypothetical protein
VRDRRIKLEKFLHVLRDGTARMDNVKSANKIKHFFTDNLFWKKVRSINHKSSNHSNLVCSFLLTSNAFALSTFQLGSEWNPHFRY